MGRTTLPTLASAGLALLITGSSGVEADEARLLRQPTLSSSDLAFVHGGELWVVDRQGGEARRLTTTPAVESHPHFSPDGERIAFSSNRAGDRSVWVVPTQGGNPTRLVWYPADSLVSGWSPDGTKILYASTRATAPASFNRLWTVPAEGGPSALLPSPWGNDGAFSPDGSRLVVDRMDRWDVEWRHYRGGQNTPLTILELEQLDEVRLPHENTIDVRPVWMGDTIYFLSDRDWTVNIWAFETSSGTLTQLTEFADVDVKWLAGHDGTLAFEHEGWIHLLDTAGGEPRRVEITIRADFPWAQDRWMDAADSIRSASLSATGKRALFEARGEIFTVPVEKGDTRNLTRSSGAADRAPVWSPDGEQIAWVSDATGLYELVIAAQDGLSEERRLSLGDSKMAWETTWSPDGSRIAFVDDQARVRVVELESGQIETVDVAGTNVERGEMGPSWSPDSRWLAYSKSFANRMRRIVVWSVDDGEARPVTDLMADAFSPAWDRDGRHLHFLASTDLALGSGWANTSSMHADPSYAPYSIVLRAEDPTPFVPESDEEEGEEDGEDDAEPEDPEAEDPVVIDFERIERRVVALPLPKAGYSRSLAGPEGTVFFAVDRPEGPGVDLKKFSFEEREAEDFVQDVSSASISADGSKLLFRSGEQWRVVGTDAPPEAGSGQLEMSLRLKLDPEAEWKQIFEEAWRYQRDFFYDPDLHGRDWDEVHARYAPLLPWVRHRTDLTYLLDQMNGELSVGHSFVFGGDYPETPESRVGLLGADLAAHEGRWRIERIYTYESWNPDLSAPLDRPGLEVREGHYLVGVGSDELHASQDPYELLDGRADRQTVLRINDRPVVEGAWTVTVVPIPSETALRQRAWVEDNRRKVDELSAGRVAYVWVPSTGNTGIISFDRYLFAQQDKEGAVIDERFNRGGLLDDYMVDLATRRIRAAITNEAPGGKPFQLPAGVLGPKVLLINELAGSGGDYFPWAWRQQMAGPLIGARTWGGLVKSSVHYRLVDGGGLTAPDNAVFDPVHGEWIGENRGIAPDIEVLDEALAVSQGRDLQLERGVQEVLDRLEDEGRTPVVPPPFPRPVIPGKDQ